MSDAAVKRDTIAARRAAGDADDRERRRRLVVEAAVRAIEENGAGIGLAAVADQAGLPRPHVYRLFTGKDDLDREVSRQAGRLLSAWIRPALTARGRPAEIIHGIVGSVLSWAVEHPNLYRFRAALGAPAAVDELGDALAAYLRAAGHETRPPAYVVAGLVGLVDASIVWWLDQPGETTPDGLTGWLAAQVGAVLAGMLQVDPATELDPVTPSG